MPKHLPFRNLVWGLLIDLMTGNLSSRRLDTTQDMGTGPPVVSTATPVNAESAGVVTAAAPPRTEPAEIRKRKSDVAADDDVPAVASVEINVCPEIEFVAIAD